MVFTNSYAEKACSPFLKILHTTECNFESWQDYQDLRFNHVEEDQYIKVVIEATVGDGELGDIAIDNVMLTFAECGKLGEISDSASYNSISCKLHQKYFLFRTKYHNRQL